MKIKTTDLIRAPLDWAVAVALGVVALNGNHVRVGGRLYPRPNYSSSGSEVIDLMEREKISPKWSELWGQWEVPHPKHAALGILGPTLRIAVCRCYVASKLGDEIEVPKELLDTHNHML